jgi:hypothetical protein
MGRLGSAALGLILAASCLTLTLLFPAVEFRVRSLQLLHEFAHVPLFFLVTLGLSAVFPAGEEDGFWTRLRVLLRILGFTLILGGLVELAQPHWGGMREGEDLIRDTAGACAAVLALLSWRPQVPRLARRGLQGTAALIFILYFLPVAAALLDESRARRQFPVLADFETPYQITRFASHRCDLQVVPAGAGNALRARFLPNQYPRLSLRYGPRDWRGYRALAFTCINPAEEPFYLIVRIDDIHHDNRPADRYILRLHLDPGRHEIEVPLEAVEAAPDLRPMDLAALDDLTLYGYELRRPQELLFDDFRLLP